jgi:hypothetical protein
VRITEHAADVGLGSEAGESIQVLEEFEFGHRQSMTRILQEEKSIFLRKSRGFCGGDVESYPLESRKSLYIFGMQLPVRGLAVQRGFI